MTEQPVQFMEPRESETTSKIRANAAEHWENESWLRWSRQIAKSLIDYMEANGLKRIELAERLNVSPQYLSRLLSGRENLSLKSLAQIQDKLGFDMFKIIASK